MTQYHKISQIYFLEVLNLKVKANRRYLVQSVVTISAATPISQQFQTLRRVYMCLFCVFILMGRHLATLMGPRNSGIDEWLFVEI